MKTDRWIVFSLYNSGVLDTVSFSNRDIARKYLKHVSSLGLTSIIVDAHKEFLKPLGHIINALKNKRRRLQHETN